MRKPPLCAFKIPKLIPNILSNQQLLTERLYRRGQVCVHSPGFDLGYIIVLSADWAAGHPPQHGYLAYVGQRVGHRTLEEPLDGRMLLFARGNIAVKLLERRKETALLLGPRQRLRVLPALAALSHAQRPVEQVPHVRQNLGRRAPRAVKTGKALRSTFQGTSGPVPKGRQNVAKHLDISVHTGKL